jgi:hypothetical protein
MNHPYILLNLWSHYTFNIDWLGKSEYITWGIVEETPDIKWNYASLTKNPNITWEHISSTQGRGWIAYYFIHNSNIPRRIWEEYSGPYDAGNNMSVGIEEILDDYKFYNMSIIELNNDIYKRKDLTLNIVFATKYLKWDYDRLCKNSNITWDLVLKYPELNWSFSSLCKNPNISLETILGNGGLGMGTTYASSNPSITSYDVKSHLSEKWIYTKLCRVGVLTYEMINEIFSTVPTSKNNASLMEINISNPNNTWRTYYHNYHKCHIRGKLRFGKWNAAAKIQHVFSRWNHLHNY